MKGNMYKRSLTTILLAALIAVPALASDTSTKPDATVVKKLDASAAVAKADASPAPSAPSSPQQTPAKPDAQTWWQVLLMFLIKASLAIAGPVLSVLVVTLLRRWKINLEYDQVNKLVSAAAGFAEQKSAIALKEGAQKTSGAEKLKLALDFADSLAKQYKLSAKATSKLTELIESHLGQAKLTQTPSA
jgi:hypothetical protein